MSDTIIYFAQCAPGPIRVGSTDNTDKRMRSIQGHCPYAVTLLASMPGTLMQEMWLHVELRAHKMRGEWFSPDARVLAMADEVARTGALAILPDLPAKPSRVWMNKAVDALGMSPAEFQAACGYKTIGRALEIFNRTGYATPKGAVHLYRQLAARGISAPAFCNVRDAA